jgi:ElaB/YqjD/DUF883 family membrane-anchored ribosome-binding protein
MAGTTTTPQGGADSGATAQAQEKAQEVAGQAKEQAQQAAGQAKTQVKSQIDQRSTKVGEQVTSQASDIRSVADTLREKGQDKPAQYVEQAASKIEGLGSYLTQSNADRILHDVEDFARARPTAVIGAGALLGFMASRFLKASSSERYTARAGQLPNTTTRPAYTTPPPLTGTTGVGTGVGTGNTLSGGVTPAAPATPGVPRTGDGLGVPPTPTTGGL